MMYALLMIPKVKAQANIIEKQRAGYTFTVLFA